MSTTKSQLRKLMAETLKSLSDSEKRRQSELVLNKLLNHPRYKAAKNISLYLSTSQEIDTLNILKTALEVDKKQCFIPFIDKQKRRLAAQQVSQERPDVAAAATNGELNGDAPVARMSMVRIDSMAEYNELPLNKYGIKEPRQGETNGTMATRVAKPERNDLDLVIVPGVAFSLDGRRLGHGRGYYDEFLANWSKRSSTRLYTIGLALREQIVDDPLADATHDYVIDEVLVADK